MVNYPEFHLNDPFTLTEEVNVPAEKKQDLLNQMWRNQCISDTYEPGSTFKIITAAAALEQGVVKLTDNFYCPGYSRKFYRTDIFFFMHDRCSFAGQIHICFY